MAAPGSFTSGSVLTAAEMNALPGGVLDYYQTSGDLTISSTPSDFATLGPFTLATNRLIFVNWQFPLIDSVSGATQLVMRLADYSAGGSGGTYQQQFFANLSAQSCSGSAIMSLSAGTYTFYLQLNTNTGTLRLNGAGGREHEVMMMDVGPA